MRATRGFTLVEILIVVVILGILAAIVIPQFTQASTEAKNNSLASDLQSMRSQIELYKAEHNDKAPTATNFIPLMIYTSKIDGTIGTSKVRDPNTGYEYGPYLERVPVNPFNDERDTTDTTQGSIIGVAAKQTGDNTSSWQYNQITGEIWANNDGQTADGILYVDF